MDGLLLDTERPVVDLWVEACRREGWDIDAKLPESTIGLDEGMTEKRFMESCGPSFPYARVRAAAERLFAEGAERDGIGLRPGCAALLDHLDAAGIPAAIATSSSRAGARYKLDRAGLAGRLPFVCRDDVARGKPAPDVFLAAARLLGAEPAECLGFEDSAAGLAALAAAGIRSVFVKDVVLPPTQALQSVWLRLESLDEAIPLLGGEARVKEEPTSYALKTR